eukprot:768084-Hanusia_phi.AAC.6
MAEPKRECREVEENSQEIERGQEVRSNSVISPLLRFLDDEEVVKGSKWHHCFKNCKRTTSLGTR